VAAALRSRVPTEAKNQTGQPGDVNGQEESTPPEQGSDLPPIGAIARQPPHATHLQSYTLHNCINARLYNQTATCKGLLANAYS
jgi:hypothetical protein